MKLAALALVVAGCVPLLPVPPNPDALPAADSILTVPHTLDETQQLVIDKLSMRGFTLVERHFDTQRAELRFQGNRDYSGVTTIGSVFYATFEPVSTTGTRIQLLGKPSLDHVEACPARDHRACTPVYPTQWGVTGREEADVVRGVFAELQLEASMANGSRGSA